MPRPDLTAAQRAMVDMWERHTAAVNAVGAAHLRTVQLITCRRVLSLHVKHAYEPVAASDDERILVDRLRPRGLRKQAAAGNPENTKPGRVHMHPPGRWLTAD